VNKLIKILISLRLTVICLSFAVALVFIGTIAQVDEGLYQAQNRYFRSLLIFWTPEGSHLHIPIFPGGYLIGGLLLLNLIASHISRFKFAWTKTGILLTHFGLIVLILGQFGTDLFSHESAMRLTEGESKNYSEGFRETELAIIDPSDAGNDKVYAISDRLLQKEKEIQSPKLPFAVRVKNYYPNAVVVGPDAETKPPMAKKTEADAGEFKDGLLIPVPVTNDPEQRNVPAAVVELLDKGKSLGTYFVYAGLDQPQTVEANGKAYNLALRFEREYYPFNITLLKATHERYKGTDTPKNFASRVRVENPEKHEARETVIYMNNPLRYEGLTFFQYQMDPLEMRRENSNASWSTFQVVRNPSWLTPYLACVIVALGLVIQFGIHLVKFATKRGVTPKQQVNAKTQRGKDAKIEGAKLAPEVSIP
jgi:hypothetical protein